MDAKQLYRHLYRLLDDVTPIKADCGKLCDAACCDGDEDAGMYLFPFEECMYDKQDSWMKIYDSDFLTDEKPVKIAICNGTCDRTKRPLSCRIFPLFMLEGKIEPDFRATKVCPLVAGKIELSEYNPEFVKNVKKVFNILNKFEITKKYIEKTQEIIEESKNLIDIFSTKKPLE